MAEKSGKKIFSHFTMQTMIIAAALVLLFIAAAVRFGNYLGDRPEPPVSAAAADTYTVEVKGAMEEPGVYEVPAGSRVDDVLALVQLSDDAATGSLNRAAFVSDGSELVIAAEGDSAAESGIYYGTDENDGTAITSLVNINTAGLAELETLPGIGPVKAQAIIDHREKDGAFLTKEQIMNVSGIGQATYNKLEGYISVD